MHAENVKRKWNQQFVKHEKVPRIKLIPTQFVALAFFHKCHAKPLYFDNGLNLIFLK